MKAQTLFLVLALNAASFLQAQNTAPVVTISTDIALCSGGALDIPFLVSDAETNASDLDINAVSSDNQLLPENEIQILGTGTNRTLHWSPTTQQSGSCIITLSVTDGDSETTFSYLNVSLTDNVAPVPAVSELPTYHASCQISGSDIPAPIAYDNCSGTIIGSTLSSSTIFYSGMFTIIWMFDDGNGNIQYQTQPLIVNDDQAPVPLINPLPAIVSDCSASITAPRASDNCNGILFATTNDPINYTTAGTYNVTWTYNDGNGNTTTQTQTVTINDNVAPVPEVTNLPHLAGECSVTLSSPKALDNCAGIILGTTTDPMTYYNQGTYTVTWVYDDGNGNTATQTQEVIINDNTGPAPQLSSLPTIYAECSATVSVIPVAQDGCTGGVIATTNSPLSYSTQGTHTIVWTYTDGYGNITTQNQLVVINDIIAPEPIVAQLPTLTGDCFVNVTNTPSAQDNCSGVVIGSTDDPLTYTHPGYYQITWRYVDSNDNTSYQTQFVQVLDNENPVPMTTDLQTLTGCVVEVTDMPYATDNCSGLITATTTDPLFYNIPGTYTITWTYEDIAGNITNQTQMVVVACAGIENASESNTSINVYPNPSQGEVNIVNPFSTASTLQVVNMQGQAVYNTSNIQELSTLELSHLPKGNYIVMIHTENGQVAREKIIIQ